MTRRSDSPDAEAIVIRLRPIVGITLSVRPALQSLRRITELLVADADENQLGRDERVADADEFAETVGETTKKHVLVRFELFTACPQ